MWPRMELRTQFFALLFHFRKFLEPQGGDTLGQVQMDNLGRWR